VRGWCLGCFKLTWGVDEGGEGDLHEEDPFFKMLRGIWNGRR